MARRKSAAWWEEELRGPFAPWKCSCCGRMSTFAEYEGRNGAACSECAALSCDLNEKCVIAA